MTKKCLPPSNPKSARQRFALFGRERGMALLFAIVVAVLLSLIGLSLTRSSMTEFSMSNEFEAHEKALLIADAAFNLARDELRGKDLSEVLAAPTDVPQYVSYEAPAEGSQAARNPLDPYEARNINFNNPPSPIASRTGYGFLTPAGGVAMGTGRFFACITDNDDEAPLGLLNDPRVDQDYTIYLRVLATHRASMSEMNRVGTAAKNSIAILEAVLRRDLSFDLSAPLTIYGQDVNATFSGNAFDLIGDNEHPAVTTLFDDLPGGDADEAYQSLKDALGNKGTVVGEPGPDGLSLQDGTQEIRESENPDATNAFDPTFLLRFANYLAASADNYYTGDTELSGLGVRLGTPDNPEITVATGNLAISGGGRGAGFMVVRGALEIGGAFDYDGIILVVGEGNAWLHGTNKTITGGMYVVRVENDEDGNPVFGIPTVTIEGNSNFVFDAGDLKMAINILPLKTISLREVTPDLDPAG